MSDPSLLKCKGRSVNNFKINERPYLMKWLKTFPGKYGIELLFKSREARILKPAVSLKSTIFTPTKNMFKNDKHGGLQSVYR